MSNTSAPRNWVTTIMFSVTFAVALIAVPWYGIVHGYHWGLWLGFFALLWANGLSITGGYHRLWAHSAYKAHPVLKVFYALFGAGALQNSILIWASGHRRHHRHVDHVEKDPYSAQRGLWFSHIGWMLRDYPSAEPNFDNSPDLQRDPIVMWQHRHYLALTLIMNFVPALLIGWMVGDIWGALLVPGVLRLVVNHHVTFFINSLAHFWGRQPYTDENSARDNDFLALFTYGEGYHNYHHIFQTDYRNGIRWWQFDPTKWFININSWFGLARDLKRVPEYKVRRAIVAMQFKRAEQRLAESQHADNSDWRDLLEAEYQQFKETLNALNELSQQWYDQKRQKLVEKKQVLEHKWQHAALHTRIRELEYALKMQQKRLQLFGLEFA